MQTGLIDDSGQYFEFYFDSMDNEFRDPIELVFDQFFSGDFQIELGIGSFEPNASDPTASSAFSGYKTYDGSDYLEHVPGSGQVTTSVVSNYVFEIPPEGFAKLLLAEALPLGGPFSSDFSQVSEYRLTIEGTKPVYWVQRTVSFLLTQTVIP